MNHRVFHHDALMFSEDLKRFQIFLKTSNRNKCGMIQKEYPNSASKRCVGNHQERTSVSCLSHRAPFSAASTEQISCPQQKLESQRRDLQATALGYWLGCLVEVSMKHAHLSFLFVRSKATWSMQPNSHFSPLRVAFWRATEFKSNKLSL